MENMDNVITISKDAPEHLVLSWLGVLVGMGYRYKIEGPLFRVLNENMLRIQDELKAARARTDKLPFDKDGIRVIHRAGDSDSIKVSLRPNV